MKLLIPGWNEVKLLKCTWETDYFFFFFKCRHDNSNNVTSMFMLQNTDFQNY